MNRHNQLVNDRYEALMFAKTPQAAQKAARELIRIVLGDEGIERPLDQALRETCRVLRPSQDPREQARFESEFLELAFWPSGSQTQTIAA
jgi:hypothetical protein